MTMRVINLQAENFKRLKAVEITPEGDLVTIGGKNGSGKSSVLDAIYVALKGRAAAPPKPIRAGEEKCTIKLDLGDLVITRTFHQKEGEQFTDGLKVENADGLRYATKPQEILDRLLGEIGFDPFEFCQMKAVEQAETLLQMVPLDVDLDELAEADASDFAKRRDINRDGHAAKARLDGIPKEDVPDDLPERQTLQDQLGKAAETNAAIERDRIGREALLRDITNLISSADEGEARAKELRAQADELDRNAKQRRDSADQQQKEFDALPALGEPVDVTAIQTQLREAETVLAAVERQKRRAELEKEVEDLRAQSAALTAAMEARESARQAALAVAQMPIEGLAFDINEKGKPVVTFGGVPFEQASTAEQLRASTAIAMAANPQLRVLRIKDGSLLDEDSMKLLGDIVAENEFQLWVEVVRTDESVGVIMEAGEVKAAPVEAKKPKAKAVKDDKPEGALV